MSIHTYIHTYGSVRGLLVTGVGKGDGDQSSNPLQDCLYFT